MGEKMKTVAKNEFKPISAVKEIVKRFSEAGNAFSICVIWTKDQEFKFETRLTLFDQLENVLCFQFPKRFEMPKFQQVLAKNRTTECFLNLKHSNGTLFFTSRFLAYDKTGMKFSMPQKLHVVQRRNNTRFTIPMGRLMKVEYEDPLFPEITHKKKVIDISTGGLSFICSENDALSLVEGLVLRNFQLVIKTKKLIMEATVVYVKKLPANME